LEILWLLGCILADGLIDCSNNFIVDGEILGGLKEEIKTEIGVVLLIHANLDDLMESKITTSRNRLKTLVKVELNEVVWVSVIIIC
jgi:predicted amidohydrolase